MTVIGLSDLVRPRFETVPRPDERRLRRTASFGPAANGAKVQRWAASNAVGMVLPLVYSPPFESVQRHDRLATAEQCVDTTVVAVN